MWWAEQAAHTTRGTHSLSPAAAGADDMSCAGTGWQLAGLLPCMYPPTLVAMCGSSSSVSSRGFSAFTAKCDSTPSGLVLNEPSTVPAQ